MKLNLENRWKWGLWRVKERGQKRGKLVRHEDEKRQILVNMRIWGVLGLFRIEKGKMRERNGCQDDFSFGFFSQGANEEFY